VVIPIKLEPCQSPSSIENRQYADFSTGYMRALEKLEGTLRRLGAFDLVAPINKELVPLVFAQGIHLDDQRLAERDRQLAPRIRAEAELTKKQLSWRLFDRSERWMIGLH
jgi:hypothetical protein